MITDVLKEKVNDKINFMKETILNKYGIIVNPSISYDLESSRSIGLFSISEDKIFLNKHLLIEFGDVYIENVLVHEFCHSVIFKIYPHQINIKNGKKIMPHGKEFKSVCVLFGNEGKATTSLFKNSQFLKNSKRKKQKKYSHSCQCRNHIVSGIKHNRMLKGNNYICKHCKTRLDVDKWTIVE